LEIQSGRDLLSPVGGAQEFPGCARRTLCSRRLYPPRSAGPAGDSGSAAKSCDENHDWNHKRIYRVFKRMQLNLRRAANKRLPKRVRVPVYVPRLPDMIWSADFMSDTLFNAWRFRTFNLVDDFHREVLHMEIDTSITSPRLMRIFERHRTEHGLPQELRTDHGPEFLGEAFTAWAKDAGMAIQYIQPGKPNKNANIERFKRTYRNEFLGQHLFASLEDVREVTYWWMIEYNEERPHDLLGDFTHLEERAKT